MLGTLDRAATVDQWARDFAVYIDRAEQVGRDVRVELLARLARVGVFPLILGEDIEHRRSRGWTREQIGTVLDALATSTYRAASDARARESAALARAMFDAMADRDPCSLPELAARLP